MYRRTVIITCFLSTLASAQPNTLTRAETQSGWTLLFDGHSFTNWRDPALMTPPGDGWNIDDGALHTKPNPHHKDDLISNDLFTNFELAFEFRVGPGANGGIKYLIQRWFCMASDASLPFGPSTPSRQTQRADLRPGEKMACNELALEYQILDDERHSDGKTPNKRTASVYGLIAPSYGLIAPSNAKAKSIGEWNAGRIVVKGMLVEHWLNGERVITADTGTKEIAEHLKGGGRYLQRQCPIALQHHNEPLWYRSIKIRKLAD